MHGLLGSNRPSCRMPQEAFISRAIEVFRRALPPLTITSLCRESAGLGILLELAEHPFALLTASSTTTIPTGTEARSRLLSVLFPGQKHSNSQGRGSTLPIPTTGKFLLLPRSRLFAPQPF